MQPERRANELFLKIQHAANLLQRLPRSEPQQNDDTIADLEYARAPNPELRSFSEQGRHGGILNPNNVPDQVMADWLAEHNDPREHIVRQDLAMRGTGAPGDYGRNLADALVRVAGPDADSHTIGRERHDLGDGNYLYAVPYGTKFNDLRSTTGFELQWESPHSIYSGFFTPDEARNILTGLGVDSQHIRQQPESEPEQEPEQEYARAPHGAEINEFARKGFESGEFDPNNTADAVFADWLQDHDDPRSMIVRRDLEHRAAVQDQKDFFGHVLATHGRGASHFGRTESLRLGNGHSLFLEPYTVRGDRPESFTVSWHLPLQNELAPLYAGAFSPEETEQIVRGLGLNSRYFPQQSEPEQEQQPDEQLARYDEHPVEYSWTHEDFHRAIQDNIHDFTNQLAYADWMEENGMPTAAAFIRASTEQAHRKGSYYSGMDLGAQPFERVSHHNYAIASPIGDVHMHIPNMADPKGSNFFWTLRGIPSGDVREWTNGLMNEGFPDYRDVIGGQEIHPAMIHPRYNRGWEEPPEQPAAPEQPEQNAAYEPPIDYAGNPRDLTNMFRTIHPRAWRGAPNADMTSRVVTADMLDELGRHREAAILRDTRRHAYLEGGEVHDSGDLVRELQGNPFLDQQEHQLVNTALWSTHTDFGPEGEETGANGRPLDENFTIQDIHPHTLASMFADWRHFKDTSGYNMDQSDDAQHFWLSRNGHGTGFFDAEDWSPEQRQELQQKAQQHGEYDLYVGDDGMIHGSYEVDPNLPSIDEQMNQPEQNAADPPMDYGPNRRIAGWIPPPHKKIYPASPRPSTEIRPGRGPQAQLYADAEDKVIPNVDFDAPRPSHESWEGYGHLDDYLEQFPFSNVERKLVPVTDLNPVLPHGKQERVPSEALTDEQKKLPFPAPILVDKNGTLTIADGNHRIHHWIQQGYTHIPSYVIRPYSPDQLFGVVRKLLEQHGPMTENDIKGKMDWGWGRSPRYYIDQALSHGLDTGQLAITDEGLVHLPIHARTQQPDEQLARYDNQIDYAEASERDLRNLFKAVRENPYDETLHAALADALQELYPDSPIHDLIRQKFAIGPYSGQDRQQNLWHPEFENSWDGSFPYTARLGRHGPFNLYLGHEGGRDAYTGADYPSQHSRWIVHAVSRFPETRDTGYTFEFPHEQAHLIPQMFPAASMYIENSSPDELRNVAINSDDFRSYEANRFDQHMDNDERNRGDDYAAYGADEEYDEDQYSPEEIERMKSSDQEWKRDRQHKQDQAESDRRNLEEMRKRRGNPPAEYDRVDYVDQQTVNDLLAQLASDEHNHTRWATPNQRDETQRLVTADALEEMGRDQEAQWLRDLDQHVMVQDGKVWPAHFHYNDVRNAFRDLHNTAATLTNGLVSPADEMALVPSGNPMSYMWRRWIGLEPEDFAEPPEEPGHGEVSVVHFGPENNEYGPVNVNVHHSKLGNHLADEVSREMEPYVDWENVPADDMAELDEAEKRLRTAPYEALDISKMPGPRQQEPDEQLARYAGNPYDEDYLASIPWDRVVGGTPNPTGRPPTPLPGGQLPKPGQVAPPPGPMPPPIQKPSGVLESDEDYLAGIPWDRVQPQPGQYDDDDALRYGDQESFEQNIDENPLESANHLVYADWLDENGQPEEAAFRRALGKRLSDPKKHSIYAPIIGTTQHNRPWALSLSSGGVLHPNLDQLERDVYFHVETAPWDIPGHTQIQDDPRAHYRNGTLRWRTYREMEQDLRRGFMKQLERERQLRPEEQQEPEPDEQAARYACYDDLDYHDLGPGGYPADVPHTPADDLALAIHNVSDALQAVCCMNYDDGGDSGADADSGEMGGPERDWWRNRGFAPYGRAPANEVNAIARTGWGPSMEISPATPNYTPDLILADFLADHDDPREHIVRRDVSLRGGLDLSGKPSWTKFWQNFKNHPAMQGHIRNGLERDHTLLDFDFPDGSGNYMVRELTDENGHKYHYHTWFGRDAQYDAPFTPEESQELMSRILPQQQEQEPEPDLDQFAAYGRAPHGPEMAALIQQGQEAGPHDPNNHPDAVLADWLADHDDPREHIVRRDLEHRAHPSGFNAGFMNMLGRRHRLMGTEYLNLDKDNQIVLAPYGSIEGGDPDMFGVEWRPPHTDFAYVSIMHPHEVEPILHGLGLNSRYFLQQQQEPEQEQFAAYDEGDPMDDPEPDPGPDDQPPWLRRYLDPERRRQQGMDASRRRQERLAAMSPESVLDQVHGVLEQHGELGRQHLRGHIRVPSDLLRQALELGQSQGTLTSRIHKPTGRGQVTEFWGLTNPPEQPPPDPMEQARQRLEELTRRGLAGQFDYPFSEIQELENTLGEDEADRIRQRVSADVMGGAGKRKRKRQQFAAYADDDAIGHAEANEYGIHFRTGQPVTFNFVRNTQKSPPPPPDDPYQQNLEPHGRYMIHRPPGTILPPGWEEGEMTFRNPIVMELSSNPDRIYAEGSWKHRLSNAFGVTGKRLSNALAALGHDGIVTVRGPNETAEIMDISMFHPQPDDQPEQQFAAYAMGIPDDEQFQAAMNNDPTDATIHGAYADWLDENNRPEDADFERSMMDMKQKGIYYFPGNAPIGPLPEVIGVPMSNLPDYVKELYEYTGWNPARNHPHSATMWQRVQGVPHLMWMGNAAMRNVLRGAYDWKQEQQNEPEQFMAYAEDDFPDMPGSGLAGNEWSGEIDPAAVTPDQYYHTENAASWNRWDSEGQHLPQSMHIESGVFHPPGYESPIPVYHWVHEDEDDNAVNEGDWTHELEHALNGAADFATENDEEPPEPDDSDIPSDVSGNSWGDRDEIASYTYRGSERAVRLEEGEFEFGGQTHTAYRWSTRHDSDGDWTLDRDYAVRGGEEYASEMHEEPEEEEDESGLIHGYPYKPDWEPLGDNPPFQGVELETQLKNTSKLTLDDAANRTLNILNQGYGFEEFAFLKEDSSIESGSPHTGKGTFEIVTHPATLAVHREQWMPFFQNIPQGLISHDARAGLHVHVGREGLSDLMVGKMLHFINNPNNKDFLVELARREVPRWAGFDPNVKAWDVNKSRRRYTALNVGKETIEFRLFRGTFKPESFFAALEFVDALVNLSRPAQSSVSDMESPNALLWYVTNNAKEYPNLMQFVERYLEQPVGQPGQVHMARYQNQIAHYPIPLSVSVRFWMDV